MRKALVVGIDYYQHITSLSGCVNDAHGVKAMLDRHADGSVNFGVRLLTGTGGGSSIERSELREAVRDLFADDSEIALLYFAGHGYIDETGGFLCASDSQWGDDGLSLHEVMTFATKSASKNKVIVLDCCHSGIAGERSIAPKLAEIQEGMTILTASTAEQYSMEVEGGGAGVFTNLFIDALGGSAANLVGEITPGAVYAHIDQSLGPWSQRPVFKTNVKTFVSLRRVQPPLPLSDLQRIAELFPEPGYDFKLDPTYEPERSCNEDSSLPPPNPAHTAIFAILQKYKVTFPVVQNPLQNPLKISLASTIRITSTGPSVIMKLPASRHIFEIGISSASPIAPWICMQRSATRKPSSVPAILSWSGFRASP